MLARCQEPNFNRDRQRLARMKALNDPHSDAFSPTVFLRWDIIDLTLPDFLQRNLLKPYVYWVREIVRNPTDVVMVTHLIPYLTTSLPSRANIASHNLSGGDLLEPRRRLPAMPHVRPHSESRKPCTDFENHSQRGDEYCFYCC